MGLVPLLKEITHIRFENRKMNTAKTYMLALLLAGVLMWEANASPGTCEASPVHEGEQGKIDFFFSTRLSLDSIRKFFLYVRFSGATGDIFRCRGPVVNCTVLDARFKFRGLHSRNMTLEIPRVTPELQGRYTLRISYRGRFLPNIVCNLTVLHPDDADSKEGGTHVIKIMAVVLVSIALLILTAVITLLYLRIRCPDILRNIICFKNNNGQSQSQRPVREGEPGNTEDVSSPARPINAAGNDGSNRSTLQAEVYQTAEITARPNTTSMDSGYSSTQPTMSSVPGTDTSAGGQECGETRPPRTKPRKTGSSVTYRRVPQDESISSDITIH